MPDHRLHDRLLDVRPDRLDLRDRVFQPALVNLPGEYPGRHAIDYFIPKYEDAGLVLDQGSEGACTGFGLACLVNYLEWTRPWRARLLAGLSDLPVPEEIVRVSPRMLYHLARFYDEWDGEDYDGSSCRGAMKGWHRHGVCSDELWPYNEGGFVPPTDGWQANAAKRPLGAYYRVDKDSVSDLQAAIYEVGAVYVSAGVHDGWFVDPADSLEKAVVEPHAEEDGGHAFAFVGYTADGFIVQNSWGPDWGYHGFAILKYEDWVAHGWDAWVAVIGAPTRPQVDDTFVRDRSKAVVGLEGVSLAAHIEAEMGAKSTKTPWSASNALQHSVVLGNDGVPLNRLVDVDSGTDAVERIVGDNVQAWTNKKKSNRSVVLYLHGGLTDEENGLARARNVGPWLLANGVYPIFVNWKTGIWETLDYMRADVFGGEQATRAEGWSDWWKQVQDRAAEARDYSIEVVARRVVKPFWTEMKENAASATAEGRGTNLVVKHLAAHHKRLAKLDRDFQVHVIAHSAGAILFGQMLDLFRRRRLPVASCTLWAPACTVEFARRTYGEAIEKGRLAANEQDEFVAKQFGIELLTDELEREDSAGPYGKSILYLVSRALEARHKTPILGLQHAWSSEPNANQPEWIRNVVEDWVGFTDSQGLEIAHLQSGRTFVTRTDDSSTDARESTIEIPATHGAFDNDLGALNRALQRILGRKPRVPVTDLRGF